MRSVHLTFDVLLLGELKRLLWQGLEVLVWEKKDNCKSHCVVINSSIVIVCHHGSHCSTMCTVLIII